MINIMTREEYEIGEVVHRTVALLAAEFPGLSVLTMEGWDGFKATLLATYTDQGWAAAWRYAEQFTARHILSHVADLDVTHDAINRALDIYPFYDDTGPAESEP